MSTILIDTESIIEILLNDKAFHAKLKCTKAQILHPEKYIAISFELLENNFLLKHGENIEIYLSPFNTIENESEFQSHVTWHLRYFFSTEAIPVFVRL